MVLYGTDIEKAETDLIKKNFSKAELVDPGVYENHPEKFNQGLKYCFGLIDGCDALVFSKLLGKVTAGVGREVNYTLSKRIPVYKLDSGVIKRINKPVKYLSREATLRHYDFWRKVTGRTHPSILVEEDSAQNL